MMARSSCSGDIAVITCSRTRNALILVSYNYDDTNELCIIAILLQPLEAGRFWRHLWMAVLIQKCVVVMPPPPMTTSCISMGDDQRMDPLLMICLIMKNSQLSFSHLTWPPLLGRRSHPTIVNHFQGASVVYPCRRTTCTCYVITTPWSMWMEG